MSTIKDVAKEAGVAVETVSRVLNNRGYISQRTRDKVYTAMQSIGYTPNTFAQGLSKKNMDCIAVIVPTIEHPYFSKVISVLENEASRRGYKVFLYNSNGDTSRESYILKLCQSSFVTGVLLFSAEVNAEILESLQIPTVLIEREPVGNTVSIQCDNASGGELAARHLIERGCQNMIVLSTKNTIDMPGDNRDESFIRTCRALGTLAYRYFVGTSQYLSMDYHELINRALSEHPECDGIFATSDLIAAQVIQECNEKNIQIPKDLKLIGFDDVELASLLSPTLTTIRQPVKDIAKNAIDAIEKINHKMRIEKRVLLPVSLIERASTKIIY